jgi:deoxyadenosine/deoxycytidine kinase
MDKSTTNPIIISIEGNIGSGKSTLLERLKEVCQLDPSICFIQEPVDIWNTIKDSSGETILEKYYADQHKYAFSFQMMAYITRLSVLRTALKGNYKVIFMERSIYTDSAVFAKMLFDDKKIEEIEYNIYTKWVHEFITDFPPTKFIYVRAEPDISFKRVIKRGRHGETIPLEYLQNCHKYHENWLLDKNIKSPLLTLDANTDITNNPDVFDSWLKQINRFIYDGEFGFVTIFPNAVSHQEKKYRVFH